MGTGGWTDFLEHFRGKRNAVVGAELSSASRQGVASKIGGEVNLTLPDLDVEVRLSAARFVERHRGLVGMKGSDEVNS